VRRAALLILVVLVADCKRGAARGFSPGLPSEVAAVSSACPPPLASPAQAAPPAKAPESFAELAARADSAVVFVRTLQEQRGRHGERRVVGEGPPIGIGSAFVYDPDGLILTNNHVVEHATDIRITFNENRELKATVVGRDPPTDVAVLRVEAKGLPYLRLGDSDAMRVGDWVVAIGNPFALSHTVSAGIVSAKGRTGKDMEGLGDGSGYYNFVQTDASINPGNSGGPLLDLAGRVVGINTAIRAHANNIGFAIPINMVKELLPQLIAHGHVTRSWIGAKVVNPREEDIVNLGLSQRSGALVSKVLPGTAADRAGLSENDLIVAFNGEPTPTPEKLRWLVSLAGAGKHVRLRVVRGKRSFDLTVRLDELPTQPPSPEAEGVPDSDESDPFDSP
jgi:serine protease Do